MGGWGARLGHSFAVDSYDLGSNTISGFLGGSSSLKGSFGVDNYL